MKCQKHPAAPTRSFGDIIRCSECGEPVALPQGKSCPLCGGMMVDERLRGYRCAMLCDELRTRRPSL